MSKHKEPNGTLWTFHKKADATYYGMLWCANTLRALVRIPNETKGPTEPELIHLQATRQVVLSIFWRRLGAA